MCRYTFFLIVILLTNFSNAQNSGILRGFLTDSLSGEPLPYGNIFINELNEGSTSDNRGYYLFPAVPAPANYIIQVSYVGYQNKNIKISVDPNQSTLLNIQLIPVSFELQTIEKVGHRIDGGTSTDISEY